MRAVLITLILLAFQPAPPTMTIADCMLASGYSSAVPNTAVTSLVGVDAWVG